MELYRRARGKGFAPFVFTFIRTVDQNVPFLGLKYRSLCLCIHTHASLVGRCVFVSFSFMDF